MDEPCRICGGPLCFLGTLGRRDWFRCQACGLDQSRAAEETGEWATLEDDE